MNTLVSLQDENLSILTLLDPVSLYPLMTLEQEVVVDDDDGDDVEVPLLGQIFALVQQQIECLLLAAVLITLRQYRHDRTPDELVQLVAVEETISLVVHSLHIIFLYCSFDFMVIEQVQIQISKKWRVPSFDTCIMTRFD